MSFSSEHIKLQLLQMIVKEQTSKQFLLVLGLSCFFGDCFLPKNIQASNWRNKSFNIHSHFSSCFIRYCSRSKNDAMLHIVTPAQPSTTAKQGIGTITHNYLIMLVRGWVCACTFMQKVCICRCSWQAAFISLHICFVTTHLSRLRTIIWVDKSHYGPSMQLSAALPQHHR